MKPANPTPAAGGPSPVAPSSASVAGSIDPSRCKCSSAFGSEGKISIRLLIMTVAEMEAIVGGYHGDPFKVLGPHRIQRSRAAPRWEVCAFLPHAETAEVVLADQRVPMTKKHPQGLFVAQIGGEPRLYRIWATLVGGATVDFDDPYRFPPLLSAFDLHLHAEGTHYETYNMLGSHLMELEGVPGVSFAVWAPNAEVVSVIGDFNGWDSRRHPMRLRTGGIWELFLPSLA